jgi:hypothetical protein
MSWRAARSASNRAIVLGPVRREVGTIPDVVEDVGLGDPDVLEEMPWRVRNVRRAPIDRLVGEFGYGGLERHMSAAPVEQLKQLLSENVVGHRILI